MNDREIALANEPNFRPAASRVECGALAPSHQIHWPLTTGHRPLMKLRDLVASNSPMARDSTGIREVATGRLPKPGMWRNGTRASRAHLDQTTFRSAPASRELNV